VITRVVVSITSLLALLAVAGVTIGITRRSADRPSAPPIEATGWLNTAPLTPADVEGKVVLYDFWTYSCVNCVHTLPYVKAWYARYAADGLVVLSIHTPEFEFEADPRNVADFVAENGIEYPVALDPHRDTWRAWDNHYWPAFYVYDRTGARRYQHFGEGRYDETEDVLRSLLGVDPSSPRARVATG
jgi:thiol-disulfide isomerase/thioredoxin